MNDLIATIQAHIERIYGIRTGQAASDYLIGHEELSFLMPAQMSTVHTPRELFLVNPKPTDNTVEVALYFHQDLEQNLKTHNPFEKVSADNVSDFCALIEGVSHFVYYIHKASMDHSVTQLELELQAEIDKFLLLSFLVQSTPQQSVDMLDLLFENYCLENDMTPENADRYQTASRFAQKYCARLLGLIKKKQDARLAKELRAFYPLSQDEKLRHILK